MKQFMTVVLAIVALAGTVSAGYTSITDIGTLSGVVWPDGNTYTSTWSRGYAVNNAGQVVGMAETQGLTGTTHGFTWTATGGIIHLENPANWWMGGSTYDVNESGQSVGRGYYSNGNNAVVWDSSGAVQTQISGATPKACAYGVNESAEVVGNMTNNGAFLWNGTTVIDLGKYNGTNPIRPYAINVSGHIVGVHMDAANNYPRACFYDGTTWTDPGTFGHYWAVADDINDSDVIVGMASKSATEGWAFKWSPGGGMIGLDHLGYSWSIGYGINNAGVVVGAVGSAEPNWDAIQAAKTYGEHAVMWAADGTATDLNDLIDPALGWTLLRATEISENSRYITGTGLIGGQEHAFLLDLVPEPATLSLLGVGGLGLVIRRKR
jgi:probable HAF family extracellular repeat protein